MARDAVTVTTVALDTAVARPTGTTVDVSNGMTIPAGGDTRKLLIELLQTDATSRVATIPKGATSAAVRAGIGDLAITCAQDVRQYVVIESARFVQTDGAIHIDFAASFAGTVCAYRLP